MQDFKIFYSEGKSRKAQSWIWRETNWTDFVERCATPRRTSESVEQYAKMSRERQGEIKDVGGFVGAGLRDGRRKKSMVQCRTMLTYDLDYCDNAEATYAEICRREADVAFVVYSTHKHTPEKPRLRVVVPLTRQISPDEYEPIARKYAEFLGILSMCDPTTFETCRLFYWPSVSRDGEYFFRSHDGGALMPQSVAAMYEGTDWQDVTNWPMTPQEGETERMKVIHERQNNGSTVEDPLQKPGIVGAFCRAHSPISDGIRELLSDYYTPARGKFTYIGGSTIAGLDIIKDSDGIEKWAYSYHNSDPAQGQLCNIFDLVRIHRFGNLDSRAHEGAAADKLPSYKATLDYVAEDPATRIELHRQRMQQCAEDFDGIDDHEAGETPQGYTAAEDIAWAAGLKVNKRGEVEPTTMNILYILKNDPKLKGLIKYNLLTCSPEISGRTPWGSTGQWTDTDDSCLRIYLERNFNLCAKDKINDSLAQIMLENQYHPVRDYLNGLPKWDGTPRLETLFVDYVGAEDNELTRTMTRKTFTAAVKRAFEPGCKYDYCLTLVGKEGAGKSTAVAVMAGKWFNDTMTTTEGKEGLEQIQGAWIVELGELAALKRSEVEQIKSFISSQSDNYRAPYGRRKENRPRQCIFIGTTNDEYFLKGDNGNRRFWVLPVIPELRRHGIDDLRQNRDQLWAEAMHYYKQQEPLYLSEQLETESRARQAAFNDNADDPMEPMLLDFLDMELPWGWENKTIQERRDWLKNPHFDSEITYRERRSVFCPAEFIVERLGRDMSDKDYRRFSRKVCQIMQALDNWEFVKSSRHAEKIYGRQKAFKRARDVEDNDDDM